MPWRVLLDKDLVDLAELRSHVEDLVLDVNEEVGVLPQIDLG